MKVFNTLKLSTLVVPDEERIKKRAGEAINAFKDIVFPTDYTPGSKRKVRRHLSIMILSL